jgi:hypothetical protein
LASGVHTYVLVTCNYYFMWFLLSGYFCRVEGFLPLFVRALITVSAIYAFCLGSVFAIQGYEVGGFSDAVISFATFGIGTFYACWWGLRCGIVLPRRGSPNPQLGCCAPVRNLFARADITVNPIMDSIPKTIPPLPSPSSSIPVQRISDELFHIRTILL